MKVLLAVAIAQVALASIGVPETTIPGKLRLSIVSTDGASILASQDIDDSQTNGPSAEFSGIAAGTYIARAQRLTGDDVQANLGAPYEMSFIVEDKSPVEPPAPKTFGQPVSFLSVTVTAE